MGYALGIDIGGTKIATGLIDNNGNCFHRVEFPSIPTDREAMFQQVVRSLKAVLHKAKLATDDLLGIGIGVPGKVDVENGIAQFQNNLPWSNFPLVERIREYFPNGNIIIDNDVYMATYAEWVMNSKAANETFVYLTISTGISCCTIHNGDFIRGAGFAGEIGFLPVVYNPLSGRYESLENVASGTGIARLAHERHSYSAQHENVANLDASKVLADFAKGEPYAVAIMRDVFDYIAKGLYAVSCLLDPDKLILGGGVINHHPYLLDSIKKSLEKYLLPDQRGLLRRMNITQLKGDAGLVGAGLRVGDKQF